MRTRKAADVACAYIQAVNSHKAISSRSNPPLLTERRRSKRKLRMESRYFTFQKSRARPFAMKFQGSMMSVWEGDQNADVSAPLASCPCGLTYVFIAPVSVSVTVIVYSTFDRAP